MNVMLGLLLALVVGIVCRRAGPPLPAPLALTGAAPVLAMSAGDEAVDRLTLHRGASQPRNCGGHDGQILEHFAVKWVGSPSKNAAHQRRELIPRKGK
jgi:XapX domain-containing protein